MVFILSSNLRKYSRSSTASSVKTSNDEAYRYCSSNIESVGREAKDVLLVSCIFFVDIIVVVSAVVVVVVVIDVVDMLLIGVRIRLLVNLISLLKRF